MIMIMFCKNIIIKFNIEIMLSFLLPKTIQISTSNDFIQFKGPKGTFIKKIGSLKINKLIITSLKPYEHRCKFVELVQRNYSH